MPSFLHCSMFQPLHDTVFPSDRWPRDCTICKLIHCTRQDLRTSSNILVSQVDVSKHHKVHCSQPIFWYDNVQAWSQGSADIDKCEEHTKRVVVAANGQGSKVAAKATGQMKAVILEAQNALNCSKSLDIAHTSTKEKQKCKKKKKWKKKCIWRRHFSRKECNWVKQWVARKRCSVALISRQFNLLSNVCKRRRRWRRR